MPRVTGYTYDADAHCPDCTTRDFSSGVLVRDQLEYPGLDEHGIPYNLVNKRGEFIGVIFDGSETDYEQTCGSCFEPIDTAVLNECYA